VERYSRSRPRCDRVLPTLSLNRGERDASRLKRLSTVVGLGGSIRSKDPSALSVVDKFRPENEEER
jgi:hypothetical protein